MSELKIIVKNEKGKALPEVLIFIHSTNKENDFKIKNYTNIKGEFNTTDIIEGEYLVKPVLKEYSFNPSQTSF